MSKKTLTILIVIAVIVVLAVVGVMIHNTYMVANPNMPMS